MTIMSINIKWDSLSVGLLINSIAFLSLFFSLSILIGLFYFFSGSVEAKKKTFDYFITIFISIIICCILLITISITCWIVINVIYDLFNHQIS